ncbi:MAG: hypothetical protein AAB614_00535 [Patescibacteria group bacterium]
MQIIKKLIIFLPLFFLVFFSFANTSFATHIGGVLHGGSIACGSPTECQSGVCTGGVCQYPTEASIIIPSFNPPTTTTTFSDLICSIMVFFSQKIIPPVAVLMTLVIGFLFLTSQGDPAKVKLARNILLFTVIGITVGLMAPAIIALVADIFSSSAGIVTPSCVSAGSANVITNVLINLINWFAWFVALVSVATVLFSGFLFITAGDKADQLSKSWKTFVFAIIGVALSILAFSIISIVEMFIK